MSTTLAWWSALCTAAALNAAAWSVSAGLLARRRGSMPAEAYALRRQLLWLSAAYVLGCGFRSVLPMVDVPRICLHDTWVSRIVVGRSVATLAELAFAAQWALLLRESGAPLVARGIVLLIVVAEVLSWLAVLTTNNLFHAAENSLWTLAALVAVAAFASRWPYVGAQARRAIAAAVICAAAYIAFMAGVDVPMYLSRWQADLAAGHEYLPLAEGMQEIVQRCVVARDWARWREDVAWLSLYFTVAVWISIALPHAPLPEARRTL